MELTLKRCRQRNMFKVSERYFKSMVSFILEIPSHELYVVFICTLLLCNHTWRFKTINSIIYTLLPYFQRRKDNVFQVILQFPAHSSSSWLRSSLRVLSYLSLFLLSLSSFRLRHFLPRYYRCKSCSSTSPTLSWIIVDVIVVIIIAIVVVLSKRILDLHYHEYNHNCNHLIVLA